MSIPLLDRKSSESLYSQISRYLEEEIQQIHNPGEMISSEPILAERFGVNRHTLRRAIDELVTGGLLERRHGLGTFVLDQTMDYLISGGTRFTQSLESLGHGTKTEILKKVIVPARGGVTQRLQIKESDLVLWIDSLRWVDDRPFCLISHFIPYTDFKEIYDFYTEGSLHQFINRHYQIELKREKSLVTARLPQGDDASLLQTPTNMPVLRVKSMNINRDTAAPVEYAITRFRSDLVQLKIEPK
ncbi:MAG: phosphonate metabolism transcriptional regulator PhnF [Thermodesulfobacteriota bacterium]|nr:phosphonate metabolism transcriptional regulator PhnF [Thermodesulfobacteriota bacterium]